MAVASCERRDSYGCLLVVANQQPGLVRAGRFPL